ncbi:MAG TPA: response regulator transcription factor [Solirubrobacterales bacterium]|nr:response regulator transcription factor [Solirubrobacterales bacterium]
MLVDQHPLWLEVLEQLVGALGLEVAGKFTASSAAAASMEDLRPDLLITCVEMPAGEPDGIALVRDACQRLPGLKAIVLSADNDAGLIDAAFAAGARAYVLKTAQPDDLSSAIRQAFLHSVYFADSRVPPGVPEPGPQADDAPGLTRRELEILQLVAEGHSNAELARMLWVTEQTVKFHLSNIYRKLNVSNRTEASRWAQLRGIVPVRTASATA